jgi:bisphosphoglycerate-dependent phosphoglycerate mutase
MPTKDKIIAKYKALHDTLSERYYGGTRGLSKEEFDAHHAKIWADMDAELIAAGYRQPPEPVRDLPAEIDDHEARLLALEKEA